MSLRRWRAENAPPRRTPFLQQPSWPRAARWCRKVAPSRELSARAWGDCSAGAPAQCPLRRQPSPRAPRHPRASGPVTRRSRETWLARGAGRPGKVSHGEGVKRPEELHVWSASASRLDIAHQEAHLHFPLLDQEKRGCLLTLHNKRRVSIISSITRSQPSIHGSLAHSLLNPEIFHGANLRD